MATDLAGAPLLCVLCVLCGGAARVLGFSITTAAPGSAAGSPAAAGSAAAGAKAQKGQAREHTPYAATAAAGGDGGGAAAAAAAAAQTARVKLVGRIEATAIAAVAATGLHILDGSSSSGGAVSNGAGSDEGGGSSSGGSLLQPRLHRDLLALLPSGELVVHRGERGSAMLPPLLLRCSAAACALLQVLVYHT